MTQFKTENIPFKAFSPQFILGGLLVTYFTLQPWFRTLSNDVWFITSIISSSYIVYLYISKQRNLLNLPRQLKQTLWLCTLIPIISIISYLFSPLENLPLSSLEPDSRWLLIIPIIIAFRAANVGPAWIIFSLSAYTLSAFTSSLIETNLFQNLNLRANGDENAVTYGMYNATIAVMILAIFTSSYIKNKFPNLIYRKIIRTTLTGIFVIGSISAFLSGTRASVMLLPIMIIFLYAIQYSVKKAIIGSGIILIAFTVFLYSNQQSALVEKFISTPGKITSYLEKGDMRSKLTSTGQRLENWKETWCIFKKYPLLGTGPRSFSLAHQKYGGPDQCNAIQSQEEGFLQAHSVYFNTLGTLGIFGFICIALLFITSIKHGKLALKNHNSSIRLGGLLLITALLSHAINGITVDLWYKNHAISKNLLIWALPLILIFSPQSNHVSKNPP